MIKGVVGVGVRQLAVGLAGQHLLHHGTVLVVGIGDLVLPVGHGGELVALVVAHGKGNRFSIHAGDDLPGHVPGLVVGILLAVACGLQEAGELAQRVIGIGILGGLAVFSAHLARDVAVLVVAVAEGDVACAAGGLGEQIANAVIAVCRCQGAGCSFNPPACRIVGVGGSTPVWNEGFTFNYLDLLNPFDNDTYQSQL